MKTYSSLIGKEIKLNSTFKFSPKFIFFSLCTMSFTYFGKTTYYLNALNGNDTLNGLSTSNPWQTIDKINTITLYPGDRFRFCSGQTFLGMFQPVGNGNIINPIIIDHI